MVLIIIYKMGFKTLLIILISVLVTVLLMQNGGTVPIKVVFVGFTISKIGLMGAMLLLGFVAGWLVCKQATSIETPKSGYQNIPLEINNSYDADQEYISMEPKKGLSDEDREYIN
ncbi:MAG: LapA family protein [Sphingobacteriales bacterium]|nr:MAG: LapA family protein [Sphingobacteriales bacterium]